uniref:Uncharacterized protein n=1 Tax=Lotharella oceanica TaxID=641309 RepID=A0A7S2XAP6_9EUKA
MRASSSTKKCSDVDVEARIKSSVSSSNVKSSQEPIGDDVKTAEDLRNGTNSNSKFLSARYRRSNLASDVEQIVPYGKAARILRSSDVAKVDKAFRSMPDLFAVRAKHRRTNVALNLKNILPLGKAARILGPDDCSTTMSADGLPTGSLVTMSLATVSSASAPNLTKSRSLPTKKGSFARKKGWFWKASSTHPIIFVIGIAGAGKTSILEKFGRVITSSPFNGFEYETVDAPGARLVSWTISGDGQRITPTWRDDAHTGVVFVLDSSDCKLIEKSRHALHKYLVEYSTTSELPLLVLATKQDVPHSMSIQQIVRRLRLGSVQRPWQCKGTSARAESECVARSFEWLLYELGTSSDALVQRGESRPKRKSLMRVFGKLWRRESRKT